MKRGVAHVTNDSKKISGRPFRKRPRMARGLCIARPNHRKIAGSHFTVAHFDLDQSKCCGKGSNGVVYEAVLTADFAPWRCGERVAVKLHNEPSLALTHAQYMLLVCPGAFDHDAVVQTRVAFDVRGLCVYVQALCTAVLCHDPDLPDFLRTISGRLSSAGLAHCDIKLHNILRTATNQLQLCDLDSLCAPRGSATPRISAGFGGFSQYLFPVSPDPECVTLHADFNFERGQKVVQDAAMSFATFMTYACEVKMIDGLHICMTTLGADISKLSSIAKLVDSDMYTDLRKKYALAVACWKSDQESAFLFKTHFD